MDGQKFSFHLLKKFLFEKAVSSNLGLGWRLWVRPWAVEWDPRGVHPIPALTKYGTLS